MPEMTSVTIRVLEGMEQGRVYSRLQLPLTMGREDENNIQLNDDRISRFHARLQDHSGRVILTDLDSTNGTRVNGHPIQMRVLQVGDVIAVGRCILLLSERQDDRSARSAVKGEEHRTQFDHKDTIDDDDSKHLDIIEPLPGLAEEPVELFPKGQPELPSRMNGLQKVQLSDLLSYLHEQVGHVVKESREDLDSTNVRLIHCDWEAWSHLVSLQSGLAQYIRRINTPDP
jgi:hypothetical protein